MKVPERYRRCIADVCAGWTTPAYARGDNAWSLYRFFDPGIILFLLGILNIVGFFKVLQSTKTGWIWAGLATGGLTIWFWIEIAILEELHWLHAMWGLPVIAAGITMLPFIPRNLLQRGLLLCGILSSLTLCCHQYHCSVSMAELQYCFTNRQRALRHWLPYTGCCGMYWQHSIRC